MGTMSWSTMRYSTGYIVYVLIQLILVERAVGDGEYNLSLSSEEYIKLEDVNIITQHPTKSNSLLVAGDRALHILNLDTKSYEIIVGNTIQIGYREGRGSYAKFGGMHGLVALNNSAVLVSDTQNACVRFIDLEQNETRRYAGKCRYPRGNSYSVRDGRRLDGASMYWPRGLLLTERGVLVADYDALRLKIDSDVVTVVLSSEFVGRLNYLMEANGYVYISFDAGLATYNPTTGDSIWLVGDSIHTGFQDGSFSVARFDQPFGLLNVAPGLILLADGQNKVLRLINLETRMVMTICSGDAIILSEIVKSNLSLSCSESVLSSTPASIISVGNYIYVSERNNGIQKFHKSEQVKVISGNSTGVITTTEAATSSTNSSDPSTNQNLLSTQNKDSTTPVVTTDPFIETISSTAIETKSSPDITPSTTTILKLTTTHKSEQVKIISGNSTGVNITTGAATSATNSSDPSTNQNLPSTHNKESTTPVVTIEPFIETISSTAIETNSPPDIAQHNYNYNHRRILLNTTTTTFLQLTTRHTTVVLNKIRSAKFEKTPKLNSPLIIGLSVTGSVAFCAVAILIGLIIRISLKRQTNSFQPLTDERSTISRDESSSANTNQKSSGNEVINRNSINIRTRPLPELPIAPETYYELVNHPDSVYLQPDDGDDGESDIDDEYFGPYISYQ